MAVNFHSTVIRRNLVNVANELRQNQKFNAKALDELAFFFGRREEQRIARPTQNVIGMGFKADDRRLQMVHFGYRFQCAEKCLMPQMASVKITHCHSAFHFHNPSNTVAI